MLSQRTALKFFGVSDPIGRIATINGRYPMIVTAILKNVPHGTQLKANVLVPNTSKADPTPSAYKTNWDDFPSYLYVRLLPGTHTDQVLTLIQQLVRRHIHLNGQYNTEGVTIECVQPHLTPFVRAHLSRCCCSLTPDGNWFEIYSLLTLAALILLIACFNYANLATARALQRARDVALRKVHGAARGQLIFQFLVESTVTALLALPAALALVELVTPSFDSLIGRSLTLNYISDWRLLILIAGVTMLTGILGGLYPTAVLLGFRPAAALRESRNSGGGFRRVRMGIVIFQFAVSIGLGISAIVVFTQLRYAEQIILGFKRSHIIVVNNVSTLPKAERKDFARAVAKAPSISGTAFSRTTPFDGNIEFAKVRWPGALKPTVFPVWDAVFRYFSIYHMNLLAGRLLSAARANDTEPFNAAGHFNVIITEKAAHTLGYTPRDVIGKTIKLERHPMTIVGVVPNQWDEGPQGKLDAKNILA